MSIEELGEPVEVPPERAGQVPRLLLALVGIGVVIGVIAGVGSGALGRFAQTEAGLCRITVAACTELSAASVEQLSGIELPVGAVVVSGYAQELGTLHEFRAEVVLPEGGQVTMSTSYDEAGDAAVASDLTEIRTWSRPISAGEGYSNAITGTRDGRVIVVFDEKYTAP